ncbi:SURF1 family protein [Microbulbifer agarilyticus]|uniref:SURF1 family protein n=1 Tax=Microbulbifer agarilyticus TaxID=260552 RepID=UPI001CD47429|nr:SURF1 family protein [Microbulbifer agarilyticus]MCA0893597.1 SURF1 family protein [Microbulbifer agarilyticus]
MIAPKKSQQQRDQAVQTGNSAHSAHLAKGQDHLARGASVAFIRNWPLTVLSLCFFPLLLGLGNWQLQRAAEKETIQRQVDARLSAQPIKISDLSTPATYTPVRLLGFYTDEYFLLDNRTRNGRVGYEVVQVFETGSGGAEKARWLINRGWISGNSHRDQLPQVSYPLAAKVITGFLYPNGDSTEDTDALPAVAVHGRIQSLAQLRAHNIGLQQPDWHIRLSADSDTALLTDWKLLTTSPAKHTGYAVQWFAMAFALVVMWLLAATNLQQIVREKWFK